MATKQETRSTEERYALFWLQFRLFPMSWTNALIDHPQVIYLIFLVTYGAFLLGLIISSDMGKFIILQRPDTFRPWIGEVFVGWAELHILTLTMLPVSWAYLRWVSMIPAIFEWFRKPIHRLKPKHGDFDTKYLAYLQEYKKLLQSKTYSAIASVSVITIVAIFMLMLGFGNLESLQFMLSELWRSALLIFFFVWAYFLGLGAWPVFVTMQFIKGLSDDFYFEIQPSHPDKCGGLKPLGDFCFAMSLPIIIGGLVLGFVGVAGVSLAIGEAGANLYRYFGFCTNCTFTPFSAYFSLILLIFFFTPLIFATFFVPLWKIHHVMISSRREAEDDFATRVANLEEQIRSGIKSDADVGEAKIAKDKLEIIKVLDPNTTGYPTWPFRASLFLVLFSPQILSIAGFVLSVYQVVR